MKLNHKGLLVVLSGPSGVGKGSVRKALFNMKGHNLTYSISMTTRAIRPGEENGREYYFVDKDEFKRQINQGNLLEYNEFVDNFYGTPRDKVEALMAEGKEVFLEIDVNGAMQVKRACPEAVLIFLVPPTKKALYDRLMKRGTEEEYEVQARIAKADSEFMLAQNYDYIVVNDEVTNAADRILAIIRAEHAKTSRTLNEYIKMMKED